MNRQINVCAAQSSKCLSFSHKEIGISAWSRGNLSIPGTLERCDEAGELWHLQWDRKKHDAQVHPDFVCGLWLPRMLMPPLWVSASLTLMLFNITCPPAFLSGQTRCLWESTLYTVRHYISFLRAIVSKCHNSGAYHNRNVLSHSFGV